MIKIKTLSCGVRVAMDKTDYVQSVAIGIWVRAGAIDEEGKYSGISHFIEHMMFKGTEKRTAKGIAEEIDNLGGQMNAFTGKEATCYYVKTLSTNLKKSADVLLDMLSNSLFDKHEMTRERKVIYEEIKMTKDAPDEDAHDTISSIVNKGNPLGKSIIGTKTTLKNISQKAIKNYIQKEYTRDSIVVAIAGNFDEDEMCDYLEGKFAKFEGKKEEKSHEIIPYAPGFKVKKKDIEQAHFFLGTEGVSLKDDDYYKMAMLGNILGGGMSSRLFQSVREEKGLAYSVFSANASAAMGGAFYIYAGVSHKNLKPAMLAVKEELLKLDKGGVTKEELSKCKEQLKASFIFGQENVASKMISLGRSLLLKGEVRSDEEVLKIVDDISLEDIQKTAKRITDPEKYSAVAITNRYVDLKKILQS